MVEHDWRSKILDKRLKEVLMDIKKMAKDEIWSKSFVAKCLLGLEQCLKVEGIDYDELDAITEEVWEGCNLPAVSLVTDSKVIERFGEEIGREVLDEID